VLKISVVVESNLAVEFALEGKLVGPWVKELRRLVRKALREKKSVSLDLEHVWFVDSTGAALLRDLTQKQVSQLNCSQFIRQQVEKVGK